MTILKGGCACGEINYTIDAKPSFSFHCQCRQCQRITGTGHASQFAVPVDSVAISGKIKYFGLVSDAGNDVSSGFCGNCGSPILKKTSGYPDSLFFHAGSLEDPSIFNPDTLVWSDSGQKWDYINPELK